MTSSFCLCSRKGTAPKSSRGASVKARAATAAKQRLGLDRGEHGDILEIAERAPPRSKTQVSSPETETETATGTATETGTGAATADGDGDGGRTGAC